MAQSRVIDTDRSDALNRMDMVTISRAYILQMVREVPGYKGLLLDKETMRTCSILFGRTELGQHSVFHVERLDAADGAQHTELKAVCFLRPTRENVTALKRELRNPRFQSYHLYFTNLVSAMQLTDLAEADAAQEQVQAVQEFFGDCVVLEPHHFTIPTPCNALLINPRGAAASAAVSEYEVTDRCVQGLSALFLALRRRPLIRYARGSEAAQRLADGLYSLMYRQQTGVFDFGSRSAPLLLLLDRRDDPVSPLLTQWTYQAMIHELLGLRDNMVTLSSARVSEQYREVVLDARADDFYAHHLYTNYGDVGMEVKALVDGFASRSAAHKQVQSLADMQRFVAEHQDFSAQQGNATKHVHVMVALSEVVGARNLMEVSMLEQEMGTQAAALSAASMHDSVAALVSNPQTADKDRARLLALYALRFEGEHARVRSLLAAAEAAGLRARAPALMAAAEGVLEYAGADKRRGDLYGRASILGKARAVLKGLQGVDNVYTQHTPLLADTLAAVAAGTLPLAAHPFMAGSQEEAAAWSAQSKAQPPAQLVVFILGGSTYEEARCVAEWNAKTRQGPRVLLGGTALLNTDEFLAALGAGAGPEQRAAHSGDTTSALR